MWRISVAALVLVGLFAVEGYYQSEYYPGERNFRDRRRKGDYGHFAVQEVHQPEQWELLRERPEDPTQVKRLRERPEDPVQVKRLRERPEDPVQDDRQPSNDYPARAPRRQQSEAKKETVYWDFTKTQRSRRTQRKRPRSNVYAHSGLPRSGDPRTKGPRTSLRRLDERQDARPEYIDRQEGGKKNNRNKKNSKRIDTEYIQIARNRSTRQPTRQSSTVRYESCRDTVTYCTFWKRIGCCEIAIGRRYCPRTCQICHVQQLMCPSAYRYGCCWDGQAAVDRLKTNCPVCRDRPGMICRQPWIPRDCDLREEAALITRALCPETCGACLDYST